MEAEPWPVDAPDWESLPLRATSDISVDDDVVTFRAEVDDEETLAELWTAFHEAGYALERKPLDDDTRYEFTAKPSRSAGIEATQVGLLGAAVLTTLAAGAQWSGADPLSIEVLQAVPFAFSLLFILVVHELGHVAAARYHGVDASLPYVIPIPNHFGTLGAIIKIDQRIPTRKALFDIGVAGPLAGLIAAIGVAIVGLYMQPTQPAESMHHIQLGFPPLLELLAAITGQPLEFGATLKPSPLVIAAWVGIFLTFVNLLPVGHLDGGHMVKAMLPKHAERVGSAVPMTLLTIAAYINYGLNTGQLTWVIWVIWFAIALFLLFLGYAEPVNGGEIGRRRKVVGVLTFGLGLLCFTPVPIMLG